MPPEFDLLIEKWIPCRFLGGKIQLLSLRDTLVRAHELEGLHSDSPVTVAALMRFLLAVLHDALEGPRDTPHRAELWRRGQWDPAMLDGYFSKVRDRFDLFHPEFPFYQEAGFTVSKPKSIANLAPELATGNNATLFDHTLDAEPPLVPAAEAARWLLTYQAYCLGGLDKSVSERYGPSPSFAQSPAVKGCSLFPQGKNLFETLLLGLVPYTSREPLRSGKDDQPLWARTSPPRRGTRYPDGYLDYLTWPARVIRLEPEGEPGNWSVRLIHVSQGSAVDEEAVRADPFFAWKVGKQGVYPFRLTADRALWRDSGALFGFSLNAEPGKGGVAPQPAVLQQAQALRELLEWPERWSLWLAGLDFDQAKVNLWRSEHLPLPARLLATDEPFPLLQTAVQTGEQAGRALRDTVRFLARQLLSPDDPAGADPRQVGTLAEGWRVEELYWPALEAPLRDFLLQAERDVEEGTDAGQHAWKESVARAAWRAFFQAARLAGDDARAYRARVAAERILGSGLRDLALPTEGVKDE